MKTKKEVNECKNCIKYSVYFKKGYSARTMREIGEVCGNKKLYQCPNLECNSLIIK